MPLDVRHLSHDELLHYARMGLLPITAAAIEALAKALQARAEEVKELEFEAEYTLRGEVW